MSSGLRAHLQKLVRVNWLSVHRTPPTDRSREERSLESSVDLRLESLSNDLVRFFATLSRQKDDEVHAFQESIFVSLLEQKATVDLFDTKHLEKLEDFRAALVSIFSELHVTEESKETLISSFMNRAEAVRRTMKPRGRVVSLSEEDIVVFTDLRRIADVVDRWNKLQEQLATVFSQRDKWLMIANDLFQRKKMELTESNELKFVSRTGKTLTPQMLSSGEKQLLILLSETLLQREQPAIFIADEPELSLHVLWQEKLVGSLRALNPSAQIIAATHSPDIVGPLSDHAIDMETLIP
jgi:predicted ATPase